MPSRNGSQHTDSSTTQAQADNLEGDGGLLRELKGAPLSVLIALQLHGEQGRVELVEQTGWSYSAVQSGVKKLEDMGLVRRVNYRSWSLAGGVTLAAGLRLSQPTEVVLKNTSCSEVVSANSSRSKEVAGNGSESSTEVVSRNSSVVGKTTELFTENSSSTEVVPKCTSAQPYDHDGVIYNNDQLKHLEHHSNTNTTRAKLLARALQALEPPFNNAQDWLQEVSPDLVEAWLEHLEGLDRETRGRIRNEAAFLRSKVESGRDPPRGKHPAPCEQCGKAIRDAQGRCLVCLGLVGV